MSIVKNTPHYLKHSKKSFTTLQNSTLEAIKDPSTLGVYVYLASKPDDWEISETNLKNRFGKGRDYIRTRLSELKRIGLLKTIAIRDTKGRVTRWETVLYNEVQKPGIQSSGNKDIQNPENPPSGKTRHLENPPTTNKRIKKIKDINNHTHSVECDLFLDSEKQRKALMLRAKAVKHEKCRELYERLPKEIKEDKSFEDVHDECVIHYATQSSPQMVSPQRLMTWIKRDIAYAKLQESQNMPHSPKRARRRRLLKSNGKDQKRS